MLNVVVQAADTAQAGTVATGHDSAQDAAVALELVLLVADRWHYADRRPAELLLGIDRPWGDYLQFHPQEPLSAHTGPLPHHWRVMAMRPLEPVWGRCHMG